MRILLIVISSILIAMSLLLILAMPVVGIIGALFGIALLIYAVKYRKPKDTPVFINESCYPQVEDNMHTINVTGFDYYQDALVPLLTEVNDLYDLPTKELIDQFGGGDRVYRYEKATYPLHIQAETDNPHDPNAIKVFAGDVFVGYLPRGSFHEFKQYATMDGVKIHVEVYGGNYKYIAYDEDADIEMTFEAKYYKVYIESSPVRATIVFRW